MMMTLVIMMMMIIVSDADDNGDVATADGYHDPNDADNVNDDKRLTPFTKGRSAVCGDKGAGGRPSLSSLSVVLLSPSSMLSFFVAS